MNKAKFYTYMKNKGICIDEDQKRIMFLIVLAWPLTIVFWIIRETVKTIKWVISKLKKGNK